jgi:hypothetical protein
MKTTISRIAITTVGALLVTVLFGILISQAAPSQKPVTSQTLAPVADPAAASLSLRRVISIPWGIGDVLEISEDGAEILMSGHGTCWGDALMFDLRVSVAQSTTLAFAEGHTVDVCTGDEQPWDAPATVADGGALEAGPARACATAVEWAKHGIAEEQSWCKEVELAMPE